MNDGEFGKKYLKILIDVRTADNVDGKLIFRCETIDSVHLWKIVGNRIIVPEANKIGGFIL